MKFIATIIIVFISCGAFAGEKVARENEHNYMNKLLEIASNPDRGSFSIVRKTPIAIRFISLYHKRPGRLSRSKLVLSVN